MLFRANYVTPVTATCDPCYGHESQGHGSRVTGHGGHGSQGNKKSHRVQKKGHGSRGHGSRVRENESRVTGSRVTGERE